MPKPSQAPARMTSPITPTSSAVTTFNRPTRSATRSSGDRASLMVPSVISTNDIPPQYTNMRTLASRPWNGALADPQRVEYAPQQPAEPPGTRVVGRRLGAVVVAAPPGGVDRTGAVVAGIEGAGDPPRLGPAVVPLTRTDDPSVPLPSLGRSAPEPSEPGPAPGPGARSPADQAPPASAARGRSAGCRASRPRPRSPCTQRSGPRLPARSDIMPQPPAVSPKPVSSTGARSDATRPRRQATPREPGSSLNG
jgi:hypothetical protein